MKRPVWLIIPLLLASPLRAEIAAEHLEFFESKIRPLLVEHCHRCHDSRRARSELQLTSRSYMLRGGKSGQPAIVSGDPAASRLIYAVRRTDPDFKMPPDDEHALSKEQVADLERWIQSGAPWPQVSYAHRDDNQLPGSGHWAFHSPSLPELPKVHGEDWLRNNIDRFILAKLEQHGLTPPTAADRHTLIRRAKLDLLGLPPTPDEISAFVGDDSPEAYPRLIDRLLASPHYGERWGRHWLDLARYADTAGDACDMPIPEAAKYRDYVMEAFNDDLPYDVFVREQIAGDIIAFRDPGPRFRRQVIATGFLALAPRFKTDKNSDLHLVIDNAVDTIGKSMLGISLSCARCHDHKFDPITQLDYFGIYGFFSNSRFPHPGADDSRPREDFVVLTPDRQLSNGRYDEAFERRYDLREELRELQEDDEADGGASRERMAEIKRQLEEFAYLDQLEIAYSVIDAFRSPVDEPIHMRGDPDEAGPLAPRGFVRFISGDAPQIPPDESGRLQFADWITARDHPLTSRVMVNRIWQYHFGRGIVPTPNVFGTQGQPPTHPQLLDWLAHRFMDTGWSIKWLHRLIMTSATYQMSSSAGHDILERDPSNDLFSRFVRRRLSSDSLRDAILAISGQLNLAPLDEHPFPNAKGLRELFGEERPFAANYEHNRRSVYVMRRRLSQRSFDDLFDGPDTKRSTAERGNSTLPQQALYMMNSPFIERASQAFAARLLAEENAPEDRIQLAFQYAYGRPASRLEIERFMGYILERGRYARKWPIGDTSPNPENSAHWTSFCRILLMSNEFVFID